MRQHSRERLSKSLNPSVTYNYEGI